MKKLLMLFPCMLLLFSGCIALVNMYENPKSEYERSSDKGITGLGPISTYITFWLNEPFYYHQSVFPLQYENYRIKFSVGNINHYMKIPIDDIMRSLYIDDVRIVLPSGKFIDFLDENIDAIYHYDRSKEDMRFKKLKNVKLQDIDGVKRLSFEGLKEGDSIIIYFNTKIPSYFVNKVRFEYTLTIEWENGGTMKKRLTEVYNKEVKIWRKKIRGENVNKE